MSERYIEPDFPCKTPGCDHALSLYRYRRTGYCDRCTIERFVAELVELPERSHRDWSEDDPN